MIARPGPSEFADFYAGYVSLVPEADVLALLSEQPDELARLAARVAPQAETYRYQPGKWSVREVVGHVCDAERVFGYRALRIGRGDATPLPGFDEKAYVTGSHANQRPLADLAAEFAAVRNATLFLLRHLDEGDWRRVGSANGSPVSARALAFIMAGHVRHHLGVLRERYAIG